MPCSVYTHIPGHLWLIDSSACLQAVVHRQMESLLAIAGPECLPCWWLRLLCFMGQVHLSHDDGRNQERSLTAGCSLNCPPLLLLTPHWWLEWTWSREVSIGFGKDLGPMFQLDTVLTCRIHYMSQSLCTLTNKMPRFALYCWLFTGKGYLAIMSLVHFYRQN